MEYKECTKCKTIKSINDFSKDKTRPTGLYPICRECIRKYKKEYQIKNNKIILEKHKLYMKKHYNPDKQKIHHERYKKENKRRLWRYAKKIKAIEFCHPEHKRECFKCGEKNIFCLDFHHLNPSLKENNWSTMAQQHWEIIKEEMKKCIPLCRKCHTKEHREENFIEHNEEKIKEIINQIDIESQIRLEKQEKLKLFESPVFPILHDHATNDNASINAVSFESKPDPNIEDSNLHNDSSLPSEHRVDLE